MNSAGLAIGLDLNNADFSDRIRGKCLKARLPISKEDTPLLFFPGLNIDKKTAEKGLDLFEDCL